MQRNKARLYNLAASIWTKSKRQSPAEWAAENVIYPETTGIPGPRDPWLTPYMIDFSTALHDGGFFRGVRYRRVVGVTAAQSGKTANQLDVIGARLDQRPAPILYVGPSREFNTDQFEPRLMSMLDDAETLKAKVVRGRRMKKTLKHVAGVPVRLAHAGSSTALKSDPAALALIDEYDEMKANVRGQGDVLGLVEARGETYADFVTGVTSTCSRGLITLDHEDEHTDGTPGLIWWDKAEPEEIESPIWSLWQEGTRHHWAVPCRQCEAYFVPRLDTLKWPLNATPAQARREAHIECPNCGGVHLNDDKVWMNHRGAMVAPGEIVRLVGDKPLVTGQPEETPTLSFWTSGLMSPFVTIGERAERLVTARLSGDHSKIQTTMNAAMGELYALSAGGDVPEWEEVLNTRRLSLPKRSIPPEAIKLVAGVDVQGFSLYYVIRAFGPRGTSWLIDWGQVYGPTNQDAVWHALTDVLMTPIDGWQIERVLVDSGFRPNKASPGEEHKVYAYCRQHKWLCKPTKGKDVARQPYAVSRIEVKKDGSRSNKSIDLVWLSTDFFKSLVISALNVPIGQPGAFYLNSDDGVDENYARQLVSETRVVVDGKPTWVKRQRDNHIFDCEALAHAAAYSLNVYKVPDYREFDAPASEPAEEQAGALPETASKEVTPEPTAGEVLERPADAKKATASGLRDRFKKRGQRAKMRKR